jgi:ABC-type phosphate transport system substrate-binding protein
MTTMHGAKHILVRIAAVAMLVAGPALRAEEVAVVSAKSTVTTLSTSQLADIFLGKTTRFPDGSQAVPIDQSEGTQAHDEFYARITGKSAAQLKAYWSKIIFTGRGQPPKAVASSSETKKLVAANPNSIGYIEPSLVDGTVKVVTVTR